MDNFSLLTTPWLPVHLKDGSTGKLAPVNLADESVVDIAAARADLQGAAWQFLLGVLQCSMAPKNHSRWEDVWFEGLSADALQRALEPLKPAFQFGADTPSFMQDFEQLSGEKVSIASLLPEIPGAQTTKFNKDHFVKRGVTERFCPHCAALALFSLQLNAPSGGKGYRTGLRGGGPMTTLIELQEYQGIGEVGDEYGDGCYGKRAAASARTACHMVTGDSSRCVCWRYLKTCAGDDLATGYTIRRRWKRCDGLGNEYRIRF